MSLMTRRWAIDQCKGFFQLSDADEAQIRGARGQEFLLRLWEQDPQGFDEHPLTLLRQEWFHAALPVYGHGGFWAAVEQQALQGPDVTRYWPVILDYGCGTGEVARLPWIARGGDIVLCEPSAACQGYLRWKYPRHPQAVIIAPRGLQGTGPYDALICTDVFEHVPEPLALQQDLWGYLKPGGHALLGFETAFPHAGHLAEAVRQFPAWEQWLHANAEIIEIERYAWVRKPLSAGTPART